jgi:hypothetical protein
LTINWKLAIEVEATINSNAWKVVGANCDSSKINLPINLWVKLGVIVCALFAVLSFIEPFEKLFATDATSVEEAV